MELPTPIIHLNGTGRENLTREYRELLDAIKEVERCLHGATLHQRDFYIAPDTNRWERAREWRADMWEHLKALRSYAEDHLVSFIP